MKFPPLVLFPPPSGGDAFIATLKLSRSPPIRTSQRTCPSARGFIINGSCLAINPCFPPFPSVISYRHTAMPPHTELISTTDLCNWSDRIHHRMGRPESSRARFQCMRNRSVDFQGSKGQELRSVIDKFRGYGEEVKLGKFDFVVFEDITE